MRVRLTYYQNYMGKRLKDSYIRHFNNEKEVDEAVTRLYSDPAVYSVERKVLMEEGEKNG